MLNITVVYSILFQKNYRQNNFMVFLHLINIDFRNINIDRFLLWKGLILQIIIMYKLIIKIKNSFKQKNKILLIYKNYF